MKIRVSFLLFAVAFASLFAFQINVLACACCAEKGAYSISYQQPDAYILDEIAKLKFDSTATLYSDAGGEDSIKGLSIIPESYAYDFYGLMSKKTWKMTFKTGTKSGVLTLPMPTKMLSYKVDLHENDEIQADPTLYKEWRFEGTTAGTGIFASGIVAPTKYFLVLQGRGNICDNASDYTHWRLEITGKKAGYAFYGKLKQ